jgi:WD40 repeat protein
MLGDVPVSKVVAQEFPKMGWTVKSLAFAPNGEWLVVGKLDRTLLILDVTTGATLCTEEKLAQLSTVDQVSFSPDGQVVIAAGSTGAISSWAIDDAGILSDAQSLSPHERNVQCLAVGNSSPLLVTGSADGSVIWQSYRHSDEDARQLQTLTSGALAVYLLPTSDKAMATDGSTLVRIDLTPSKEIETRTRELSRNAFQSATFSSDGSKLAVTTGYKVQIWDTGTGSLLWTFDSGNEMQWTVAFHPDGQRLISGGRGFATLWNLETHTAECRFDLGGVLYIQTLAISPDGTLLAAIPAASGQTLMVLRIPE